MDTPIEQRRYVGYAADREHRKWVGKAWDLLGAEQLRIMVDHGLREFHSLLDVGCGALRGGRFLIMYLRPGMYCGIEPEEWALQEGIDNEASRGLVELKRAEFCIDADANLAVFDRTFDFVVSHSVLIHAHLGWIRKCIEALPAVLKPDGLFIANVDLGDEDSTDADFDYPQSRSFTPATLTSIAEQAGLSVEFKECRLLPLYGERQKWLLLRHASPSSE